MFLSRITRRFYNNYKSFYYRKIFKNFGEGAYVNSPLSIENPQNIFIGRNVVVQYKTWLASNPITGFEQCELIIEDGCIIGHFNHIYATRSVVLHKNVLTADKVYISDNLHGYKDINTPIHLQPVEQNGSVEIGEGSWLGENVCVLGAKIGKHCVIGANSVVTKDIPDYCVVVGAPARIIKRYDFKSGVWRNIENGGG